MQARKSTWDEIMRTSLRPEFMSDGPASVKPGDADAATATGMGMGFGEEKGPINQLVLSYLSHHGYAKTARAFQAQCERRGGLGRSPSAVDSGVAPLPVPAPAEPTRSDDVDIDMDMDLTSPSKTSPPGLLRAPASNTNTTFDGWGPGMHDGDIELRTRIVNSVICGDIDTALEETQRWHPKVLEKEEGLMRFKLRCRKFVELILEAAELKKKMNDENGAAGEWKEGAETGSVGVDGMDVDDYVGDGIGTNGYSTTLSAIPIKVKRKQSVSSHHPGSTNAAAAQYESALSSAISYGQTLQSDYKTDSRPEVRAIFKRTFGVVAYEDPLEAGGEAAEVAGHEARIALATELNQDILRKSTSLRICLHGVALTGFVSAESQGRPTHPALESLYRQTAACILQLGLLGAGAAAFADMPKEFLDA